MTKLVTQVEAARLAGVKQTSISSLKISGRWGFFVGTKIDVTHPSWFAYLSSRGLNPFGIRPQKDLDGEETDENDDLNGMEGLEDDFIHEESEHILKWKKWRAIKTEEQALKAKLEREKLQASLIPLAFVQKIIEDYLGLLHKRFLDMPQDTVDRMIQIMEAGNENARQMLVDTLIQQIEMNLKQAKKEIERMITKYEKEM